MRFIIVIVIIIIIIIIMCITDQGLGLFRLQGLKTVPSFFMPDVAGIFCHSVSVDSAGLGLGS
jgi:hypothetical protein